MTHRRPLNAGPSPVRKRRLTIALPVAVAFCWCSLPFASAAAQQTPAPMTPPTAKAITSITLERNCYGCAAGSVLVLRRDGSATFTVGGNARRGTTDAVSHGLLRVADFDAIARLAVSSGFFGLAESYADPQLQDGAWATTSMAQEGSNTPPKRVFRREDAGPPALQAVETAIESVQARIAFKPERQ